jgi:hypothetical protein
VHVEDHPPTRLGFYRPATVPPIPVTEVAAGPGRTWRDLVAEELTRPFDTARTPMARVVLLRAGPGTPAALVLTVAHVVIDGMSAVYILRDLFAALNGHRLTPLPVPRSQEELLGRLRTAQPAAAALAPASPPPAKPDWLATPNEIRPFDGAVPDLSSVSFSEDLTWPLARRARAEQATVNSALVAAMTQVIIESRRHEFVRMLIPVSTRRQVDVLGAAC